MKVYKRRIISCATIILSCVMILSVLQEYCFYFTGYNAWRIRGFYKEQSNSLDVVFIGSSDVTTDFAPGLAYDEFGFTSYLYATDSASIQLWKYQVEEVLKYQNPDVLIIEVSGALYADDDEILDTNSARWYFDGLDLSIDKARYLSSIHFGANSNNSYLNTLFPFFKFHSRIDNIPNACREKMFFNSIDNMKLRGFITRTAVDKKARITYEKNKRLPLNRVANKLLIEFLDYLKQKSNNKVVFVRFPRKVASKESIELAQRCNTAEEIIKSYGYAFVNYTLDDKKLSLDYNRDFYNEEHMNVYGAEKFTHYFGKFLYEEFVASKGTSHNNDDSWVETARITKELFNYCAESIRNNLSETTIFETPSTDFSKHKVVV